MNLWCFVMPFHVLKTGPESKVVLETLRSWFNVPSSERLQTIFRVNYFTNNKISVSFNVCELRMLKTL